MHIFILLALILHLLILKIEKMMSIVKICKSHLSICCGIKKRLSNVWYCTHVIL